MEKYYMLMVVLELQSITRQARKSMLLTLVDFHTKWDNFVKDYKKEEGFNIILLWIKDKGLFCWSFYMYRES